MRKVGYMILTTLLCAVPHLCSSQPGSSVFVAFRMFGPNGKHVDSETFNREYRAYDQYGREIHTGPQYYSDLLYNKDQQQFFLGLHAIYGPFYLTLTHASDTMVITFGSYVAVDSLPFTAGHFSLIPRGIKEPDIFFRNSPFEYYIVHFPLTDTGNYWFH